MIVMWRQDQVEVKKIQGFVFLPKVSPKIISAFFLLRHHMNKSRNKKLVSVISE